MHKNQFEKIDPRPKRRMHKDNPYRIFSIGKDTPDPHYYIKFTDAQDVEVCVEISIELFSYFDKCELADLSLLNEQDRHTDNTELTPYLMNILTNQSPDPLLEHAAKNDENRRVTHGDYDVAGQTTQALVNALLGRHELRGNGRSRRMFENGNIVFY